MTQPNTPDDPNNTAGSSNTRPQRKTRPQRLDTNPAASFRLTGTTLSDAQIEQRSNAGRAKRGRPRTDAQIDQFQNAQRNLGRSREARMEEIRQRREARQSGQRQPPLTDAAIQQGYQNLPQNPEPHNSAQPQISGHAQEVPVQAPGPLLRVDPQSTRAPGLEGPISNQNPEPHNSGVGSRKPPAKRKRIEAQAPKNALTSTERSRNLEAHRKLEAAGEEVPDSLKRLPPGRGSKVSLATPEDAQETALAAQQHARDRHRLGQRSYVERKYLNEMRDWVMDMVNTAPESSRAATDNVAERRAVLTEQLTANHERERGSPTAGLEM